MDRVEICKVQIGTEIYKVYEMCDDAGPINEFRVMHGRRIQKGGSYFNNRKKAILFTLRVAFNDISQQHIDFKA